MRVIDCFLHPIQQPSEPDLFVVDDESLCQDLPQIASRMDALNVERGLLALFRPAAMDAVVRHGSDRFVPTVLADFRAADALDRLRAMADAGIKSITFHPYLQDITRDAWPGALDYAREAARLGMFVCVCTAYGSAKIYRIDVLPFATAVAEAVDCPVVFAHCGGAKVLDAMLIADAYANVLLETSFSLTYWLGSSVEGDMAYAMRKLGAKRWLFGSDAPFIDMMRSVSDHFGFFERHGFASGEIEAIMGYNASNYLGM